MWARFSACSSPDFLAGGTADDVDGNLETTRLLRSQLRTKSELRVIDADVLPLMEVAATDRKTDGGTALPNPIKDDKDIDLYEQVFATPTTGRRSARSISSR
jgi:hypothetical protein